MRGFLGCEVRGSGFYRLQKSDPRMEKEIFEAFLDYVVKLQKLAFLGKIFENRVQNGMMQRIFLIMQHKNCLHEAAKFLCAA